jgi:hypothetical protein
MSFLEKSGVGLSVPVPVVPIKFLRVPNLLLIYITIYILNSYKDIRKDIVLKILFGTIGTTGTTGTLPFEISSSFRNTLFF